MAPRKAKESLLELCTRTTLLGNSVSIRMLEYLSTAKSHPDGFRQLAADFLETCRILWSIEAGLTDASRSREKFGVDMVQELDKKFRQTNDDFMVLNQMLLKFLDYEKKGTLGRFQKSWRMMFSGTDIDKMRDSLAKDRDALRMSALVFRRTVGDAKIEASFGIGYTGLVAALERMNGDKPTTVIAPLEADDPDTQITELPPQLPPMSLAEKSLPKPYITPILHDSPLQSPRFTNGSIHRAPSTMSSARNTHYEGPRDDRSYKYMSGDSEARTLHDDQPANGQQSPKIPTNIVRHTADLTSVPRWTSRGTYATNSSASRAALIDAVQHKDHQKMEQLLDGGVGANGGLEASLLNKACQQQDSESVRLLLLFGADANASDNEKLTPLQAATQANFLDGAKMLLKYGADTNASAGSEDESALALAIVMQRFDFVHLFLSYGADASLIMGSGNIALIKAMSKPMSPKIVELIMAYGCDVNAKNREGKTALFEAITNSRVDLMTLLIDNGANVNLPCPKHPLWPSTYTPAALKLMLSKGADAKKTPGIMELASSIRNVESIRVLLDAGVSPNIRKDGVYTPLCSAIRDNSLEIVSLLLANGADPNLNASEYPAFKCITHDRIHILPQLVSAGADLHNPKGIIETAVAHNHRDGLQFLLERGVNPNARNSDGHTALTTAIRENRVDLLDILLENGADPGIRGEDWPICMAVKRPAILKRLLDAGSNPAAIRGIMEMAVAANELDSIKMLLQAGVSVEDKTGGVFSPLTSAIRDQRKVLTRYLLEEAHADPNAPGEHLPIIKSIRRCPDNGNDTEIIEMLLARGADVNKMYRGWNAILQAVESGNSKILKVLIEKGNGVDLSVTDEYGKTVSDIVLERGWDEAIELLSVQRVEKETIGTATPLTFQPYRSMTAV